MDRVLAALEGYGLDGRELGLASVPTGRHWHFRKPGEKGTLELTSVPGEDGMVELVVEVRRNRRGEWCADAVGVVERTAVGGDSGNA
ncbi:MAG: hypothetical protein JST35_09275 [Armatimonadetes bacterium]|nr:hypothetical protein [Armatimonadota bacterium]